MVCLLEYNQIMVVRTLWSEYMLRHLLRGPGRDQRIERFWRDMFTGCTSVFYYLFYNLEERELLFPNDEYDLFSLHYAFLPQINNHLGIFCEAYNRHRLRTKVNHLSTQL